MPHCAVIDLAKAPTNFAATPSTGVLASEAVDSSLANIVTCSGVYIHTSGADAIDAAAGSSVEITSLTRSGFTGLFLRHMEE